MSDTIKIVVKEVKLSGETKGMKLVTAVNGTETKVYKFSELKQDGTPRKGYAEIKEGEFSCYINGEYIASAYPVQAQGGGFKGGGNRNSPEVQTSIIRQNVLGHAVNLVEQSGRASMGMTIAERVSMTLETALKLEKWVNEGKKHE